MQMLLQKQYTLTIITVINLSMNNPSILFMVCLVHLGLRFAFPDPPHEPLKEKGNYPCVDQSSSYRCSVSEYPVHFELQPGVATQIYETCQGSQAQSCELAMSEAVSESRMHQKLHVGHDLYEKDRAEDHVLIENFSCKQNTVCDQLYEVEVSNEPVCVLFRDYLAQNSIHEYSDNNKDVAHVCCSLLRKPSVDSLDREGVGEEFDALEDKQVVDHMAAQCVFGIDEVKIVLAYRLYVW